MATKTIVIGSDQAGNSAPIVFEKMLYINFNIDKAAGFPSNWNYIELICLDYGGELDLMFAYDDPKYRSEGTLFLGKWNSGKV